MRAPARGAERQARNLTEKLAAAAAAAGRGCSRRLQKLSRTSVTTFWNLPRKIPKSCQIFRGTRWGKVGGARDLPRGRGDEAGEGARAPDLCRPPSEFRTSLHTFTRTVAFSETK